MSTKIYNGGRVLVDTFLDRKPRVHSELHRIHSDYLIMLVAEHFARILWTEATHSLTGKRPSEHIPTRSPDFFHEILEFFNAQQQPSLPTRPIVASYNASTRIFFDVDLTNADYFLVNSSSINHTFMSKIYELLGIEDYSYFDNVDKPDDISDEVWSYRKESWDAIDSLDFTYEISPYVNVLDEEQVLKKLYSYGKDRLQFESIEDAHTAVNSSKPYTFINEELNDKLKSLRPYIENQDYSGYSEKLSEFVSPWNDISLNLQDYS